MMAPTPPGARRFTSSLLRATLLATLWLGGASTSAAAERSPARRSIGLAGDVEGALVGPLRAELGARGFGLATLETFEPANPLAVDLSAVLRIEEARGRVEIWTPDPGGAAAIFRTTVVAAQPGQDPTLAVRTAEAVRALVLAASAPEASPSPRPAEPPEVTPAKSDATSLRVGPPVSPPPPAPPGAASSPPAVGLESTPPASPAGGRGVAVGADAAVSIPVGGLGLGGAALVHVRYRPWQRIGVGARLMLPVIPSSVTRQQGTASVEARMLAAEGTAVLRSARRDSPWEASATGGFGVTWLRMTGVADAPFVGQRADVWTTLSYGAAELSRAVGPRVSLRASLLAGFAAPSVAIRFAGVPISRWGHPLAMMTLGADLAL